MATRKTLTADPSRTTARHHREVALPALKTWRDHGSPSAALYFDADHPAPYGTEVAIRQHGRHLVITGLPEGDIQVGVSKRLFLAAIPEYFAHPCAMTQHEPATHVATYPNGQTEELCDWHAGQAERIEAAVITVIPETVVNDIQLTRRPLASDPAHISAWDIDRHESPNVVVTYSNYVRRTIRFGVGYIGPRGITRKVQGGPVEQGPDAYLIPLSSCIAANGRGTGYEIERGRAAGTEFDAPTGSRLRIDGRLYEIRDDRRMDYPQLVAVES